MPAADLAQRVRAFCAAHGETLAADAAIVTAARRAMEIGKSETVDIAGQKIFLNVYVPPPRLIIVGAVHITEPLARMSALAGYGVTVIDLTTSIAGPPRAGTTTAMVLP